MYLNLIEIAESFGVSEKVVEDWIRDQGLPHTRDRGRLIFDRAQVAHWAASHGLTSRAGFLAPESSPFATNIALEPMLRAGRIWRGVAGASVVETFEVVLESMTMLSGPVRSLLGQRLRAPGGITWAPVGDGFALPHFSTRVTLGRGAGVIALVMLGTALPLADSTVDDVPVTRLFFFVPPSPRAHLDMLGRISKAILSEPLRALVKGSTQDEEIYSAVAAFERLTARGEGRGNAT